MTPEQWAEAREAFMAGESVRSIARRLGLHHSAVARQAKREGWRGHGGAGGAGGAAARSGAPDAAEDAPAEAQQPARTYDLGRLIGGDQRRQFDINDPADQRRILELTGLAPRPWAEQEARLEQLAEDQREEREDRGWLRRPSW